jgi:hypothetical protein
MNCKQFSLANQEVEWLDPDSEEMYQNNLVTSLIPLQYHNQFGKHFTYKFNSYGFRADEFDSAGSNVMSLGCSHTLGVGVPYESTWAHIVSNELKLKNYNLGVGGASNDTAFRLAYQWIDKLKPNIVIFLSTEPTRFELHTNAHVDYNEIHNISVWNFEHYKHTKEFMQHWYSDDTNSNMNYLKNMLAIKQLCDNRGIKYLHEEILNIYEQKIFAKDHARDLIHFGGKTHQRVADMFLSKL